MSCVWTDLNVEDILKYSVYSLYVKCWSAQYCSAPHYLGEVAGLCTIQTLITVLVVCMCYDVVGYIAPGKAVESVCVTKKYAFVLLGPICRLGKTVPLCRTT